MYIEFRTAKLKRICENEHLARMEWGEHLARVVMLRIVQLQAADSLKDLSHGMSIRRHKLSGKRKGQFALNLHRGYRLILQPLLANGKPDKTSDLGMIIRVRIMEVIDYHE